MKKLDLRIVRIIIIAFWIVVLIFIGLYKVDNRELRVVLRSSTDKYETEITADVINGIDKIMLDFSEITEIDVSEILIYRDYKTIRLGRIAYSEIIAYLECVINGQVDYKDNQLHIESPDGIVLVLNENGKSYMQKLSKSYLIERFILAEISFAICLLALMTCTLIEEKTNAQNRNNHGVLLEIKRFCKDIKRYWQYIIFSAKADLKAEVADSYLNRLWWLLEPLLSMLVYVIVFRNLLGSSIENFETFIFSALLMWNFFSKTINYSVKLVRSNKDIVTKVYIPKYVLLLSNMFLNLFKLLFSLIVLVPMLVIFKVQIGINFLWLFPAYCIMFLLSFGLGMICLHFGVYVDDLGYAVGILLNMMTFLSGIFYDVISGLGSPLNELMLGLNPIAVLIDTMRNALLYNNAVNIPLLGVWFVLSLEICCIGVHTVYKNENGYVKVV